MLQCCTPVLCIHDFVRSNVTTVTAICEVQWPKRDGYWWSTWLWPLRGASLPLLPCRFTIVSKLQWFQPIAYKSIGKPCFHQNYGKLASLQHPQKSFGITGEVTLKGGAGYKEDKVPALPWDGFFECTYPELSWLCCDRFWHWSNQTSSWTWMRSRPIWN